MANFVVLNTSELNKLNGGYYYDPKTVYNPGPIKFPGPIITFPGPIICYWFSIQLFKEVIWRADYSKYRK